MNRSIILSFSFSLFIFSCSENTNHPDSIKTNGQIIENKKEMIEKYETIEDFITSKSVDKVHLGMNINEVKRIYRDYQLKDTLVYYFGIDGEEGELLIAKDNKALIYVWPKDEKVVGLFALSNIFRTKSNLRPGMTIKEIKEIYPDIKISQDLMAGNNETIYIPQENVSLGFFTENNPIGNYKNSNDAQPLSNEFKSDTFRVQYIEITK